MYVCVCVCHLAEEGGLELCCGVAGVKKLAKSHLEGGGNETGLQVHSSYKSCMTYSTAAAHNL